jgi:hypothetical protein
VSPRIITILDGTVPAGLTVTTLASGLLYFLGRARQQIGFAPVLIQAFFQSGREAWANSLLRQ